MGNSFDFSSLGGWLGLISGSILLALEIIVCWRVFMKAGRPGWAMLIPVYNIYVFLKIAKRPGWWAVLYFIPVVNIIVHLVVSIDTAKVFGKRSAFGFFLLWLLPFIGYPMLAFGSVTYRAEHGAVMHKQSTLKSTQRNALVMILILFIILSGVGTGAAIYYRYQQHRVRDEVTSETTKFQNLSFDMLDEWNDQYRMTVMYPQTGNSQIDTVARIQIDQYVTDFRNLVAKKPANTPPYDLHVVGSVNFASKQVINFLYTGSWSIAGKTGNITVNAMFDRATGKEVQTSDLFKDNGYLKIASDATRKALPTILGGNYNKTLAEQGTTPVTSNFDQFQIVDTKTVDIIFESGQVADVTVGTVRVPIALDSFEHEWNQGEIGKLFPDFNAELQAQEVAQAAAAKAAAEAAQKAAVERAAAQQSHQAGNYLPAHGDVNCVKAKCIALTFDDGPGPGTNTILDTLEKYHAPATFMVVGSRVANYATQLKRENADGDDIGSHTWDHADLTSLSTSGVEAEVNKTQAAVMSILGGQPFMLRPPYGAYNSSVMKIVDMPLIMWSVDPDDWKYRDANTVYQNVMSHVKPNAIVLSHDIYPTTAAAYQRIIPDLISRGYTLVTVSNLEGINPAHLTPQVYFGAY